MRLKPLGKIGPYADKPPDTALIIDVHQDGLVHGRGVPLMLSVRHCVQSLRLFKPGAGPVSTTMADFRDRIGARHTSLSADGAKGYEADI